MRTPFWLIALVFAAAGGMAVGYVIAPQPGHTPNSPEISSESAPDREGTPPLADDAPSAEESDTPTAPRPRDNENERIPGDDPLAEVFDVEIPSAPTGNGEITGRLVNMDGQPVPGIEVRLSQRTPRPSMKLPNRADFNSEEEYIRARLKYQYVHLKMRGDTTLSRTSDANGEIVFNRLPEGTVRLNLSDSSYFIAGGRGSHIGAYEVGDSFEAVLVRLCPVSVTIKGVPESATGCRLKWHSVSEGGATGTTSFAPGESVSWDIPEGAYEFVAEVHQPSLSGGPVRVAVLPSSTTQQIEVKVRRNASVYGTLRFHGARPLHYRVFAAKVIGEATDERLLDQSRSSSAHGARLNRDSLEFYFQKGLEGHYAIGVVAGQTLVASQRITVGDNPVKLDLDVDVPSSAGRLKVVVKRPDGVRNEHENIQLAGSEPGRRISGHFWLDTDDNYLLLLNEPDSDYPWPDTVYVHIKCHERGHVREPFTPGVDSEITLEFGSAAEVYIRVRNLPATERSFILMAWKAPFADELLRNEYSNRSGYTSRYRFPPVAHVSIDKKDARSEQGARLGVLQAGEYRILMNVRSSHSIPCAEYEVAIEAGADSQQIDVEFPELHSVEIDGSGCDPYTHADLRHLGFNETEHFTFSDKTALIRDLPPGEYEVSYTANGIHGKKRTMKFTLPGTETVVLTE